MTPNRYKPMLAQSVREPFDSADWIFEIKWDGFRAISYIDNALRIASRNGEELKYNFPELQEITNLTRNVVLDGEIVVMKDGKADFQSILERNRSTNLFDTEYQSHKSPATYVLFDILEKDGKSLIDLPLIERKNILKESVREGQHVVLSIYEEENGRSYYNAAIKRGVEGVIAKRKRSPYHPGVRSSDWLKIKSLSSCECVICGYTTGEGQRKRTFGALILGLYEGIAPVYVGKVGTGFSKSTIELLKNSFRRLEAPKATLDRVDISQQITWITPVLVCEIEYQTVTRDNRLRMPRFKRLRSDKAPLECTLDQITAKPLEEYFSKRNFNVTPEPVGRPSTEGEVTTFVVQEHNSRRLHYDLRLESVGVLKSWAVPKGVPENPGDKRLAVETEDHPLGYAEFEGTIPQGEYGAGTVKIWDKGSYRLKVWDKDKIEFTLKGRRLEGRYVLARFKKAGPKQWLLIKARN